MDFKFKDDKHKEGFNTFIKLANINQADVERICLFYLLSLFNETRNNINGLYDFKGNGIMIAGLNEGWQTGSTRRVTKLAFNLYNNFRGEDVENENYSPLELFSVPDEYRKYMLYAVDIRFKF